MAIKISKSKLICTLKDCIEDEYPELWERSVSLSDNLLIFQNDILKLLPALKQKLPTNIEQIKECEAQFHLQNYIYLHSLFTYADKIWKLLDEKCRELAEATNRCDSCVDDACASLEKFLNTLDDFPFSSMLNDNVSGLMRLDKKKIIKNWTVFDSWQFSDICVVIIENGFMHEDLLRHSIDASIPSSPTIKVLLDDDKMIRIY